MGPAAGLPEIRSTNDEDVTRSEKMILQKRICESLRA